MIEHAIILAGGLGTRLRNVSGELPKPLTPFREHTIIEEILTNLRAQGIRSATICIGYKGEMIKSRLGDGSRLGIKLDYSIEPEPLGTGGALAISTIPATTFLLCNADNLLEFNLKEAYASHMACGVIGTIITTTKEDVTPYMAIESEGNIAKRLLFKPRPGQITTKQISTGYCLLEPSIILHLSRGKSSLEYDLYPKLASLMKLGTYQTSGQWFDLGTPDTYKEAIEKWKITNR